MKKGSEYKTKNLFLFDTFSKDYIRSFEGSRAVIEYYFVKDLFFPISPRQTIALNRNLISGVLLLLLLLHGAHCTLFDELL